MALRLFTEPTRLRVCSTSSWYTNSAASRSEARGETPTWELPMMREAEAWLKAGTGDDKTDILIIADAYDRAAIYSRDREITSNAQALNWGGFDARSGNFPG